MIKVGIKLEDADFTAAFVRGLMGESRNLSFVLLDDSYDGRDCNLVLSDRWDDAGHRTVALVKNPQEERIYNGPPYKVFRYKDVRQLIADLLFIYYRETGKNLEFTGDTQCKTLIFTSTLGSFDSTALALSTSEILYRYYGCRCLYLNLCPIDQSKQFLKGGQGKGLLTLLYYLERDRDFPLGEFINFYPCFDAIDTRISNPFFDELTPEQCYRLRKKIDELGKYDFLILDMGEHLSRNNKKQLAHCDHIVLLENRQHSYPAPFFSDVKNLITDLSSGARMYHVFSEALDEQGEVYTQGEDGLLDFAGMNRIQWEARRLANEIMGEDFDDSRIT